MIGEASSCADAQRHPTSALFSGREAVLLDCIRGPVLVLDLQLVITVANEEACRLFGRQLETLRGKAVHGPELNLPKRREIRSVLMSLVRKLTTVGEVELVLQGQRRRLSARTLDEQCETHRSIILTFEAASPSEGIPDQENRELLLQEMQHRIANSMQIVASMLRYRATKTESPETRQELEDIRRRVTAVAAVHRCLEYSSQQDVTPMLLYFHRLSDALANSLLGQNQNMSVSVVPLNGTLPSYQAVAMGLILSELVTNAIKHAFGNVAAGKIEVLLDMSRSQWELTVSDNGSGILSDKEPGMGTRIVRALVRKLGARISYARRPCGGTMVTVTQE